MVFEWYFFVRDLLDKDTPYQPAPDVFDNVVMMMNLVIFDESRTRKLVYI